MLTKLKSLRPGRQAEVLPRAPTAKGPSSQLWQHRRVTRLVTTQQAHKALHPTNRQPLFMTANRTEAFLFIAAKPQITSSKPQRSAPIVASGECMSWRMKMCALKIPLYSTVHFSRKGTITGHSSNKWRSSQCSAWQRGHDLSARGTPCLAPMTLGKAWQPILKRKAASIFKGIPNRQTAGSDR